MGKLCTLAVVVALLVGCSAPTTVNTDYDKNTDFSQYTKYAWAIPSDGSVKSLLDSRIENAVNTQLQSKGLTLMDSQADAQCVVAYSTNQQDKTQVYNDGWGWGWGGVDVSQYTEGTLVVAIADLQTKQMIWQGSAQKVLESSSGSESGINDAVAKMFADFPPKK